MKKPILISILVFVIIAVLGTAFYFTTQQTGEGGTILSLQRTDFVSNDPQINGQAWLLSIVQNGASQFVRETFTDINADGKVDLLVASNGYWNGNEFSGYVIEFENNGTAGEPSFQLKNNNFLNHRRYGIQCQSTDGLIEGNRFEGISRSAINIITHP